MFHAQNEKSAARYDGTRQTRAIFIYRTANRGNGARRRSPLAQISFAKRQIYALPQRRAPGRGPPRYTTANRFGHPPPVPGARNFQLVFPLSRSDLPTPDRRCLVDLTTDSTEIARVVYKHTEFKAKLRPEGKLGRGYTSN